MMLNQLKKLSFVWLSFATEEALLHLHKTIDNGGFHLGLDHSSIFLIGNCVPLFPFEMILNSPMEWTITTNCQPLIGSRSLSSSSGRMYWKYFSSMKAVVWMFHITEGCRLVAWMFHITKGYFHIHFIGPCKCSVGHCIMFCLFLKCVDPGTHKSSPLIWQSVSSGLWTFPL